jgi:hypothetical protein
MNIRLEDPTSKNILVEAGNPTVRFRAGGCSFRR